jgi:hypothetical protein
MRLVLIATVALVISAATAQGMSSGCYGSCVTKEQIRQARVAIWKVFGSHASEALRVARCESGYSVRAYNGQYLGLFQMGNYARGRYGHHPTSPWAQARAAYRYFVEAGRDWSPWACKPW